MNEAPPPAVLATVWRGQAPEAVVRGHVVVVSGAGEVVACAGDSESVTTMRSAVKSFQAIPLARARRQLTLPTDELAIACASHRGSPLHLLTARRLLARVGLDESHLSCGPQAPSDPESVLAVARSGQPPQPIHNNCSGKHAGMLAACVAHGWPVTGYAELEHPLQREIEGHIGRLFGLDDIATRPRGIDGCGLPTYGLPLSSLAVAFVAGTADGDVAACHAAMADHPVLIAGEGQLDTVVLRHMGSVAVCKGGGGAVWAAATRDSRYGIAIKLEAGSAERMAAVVGAVLSALRLLPEGAPAELMEHLFAPMRNWSGTAVGEVRVDLPKAFVSALA